MLTVLLLILSTLSGIGEPLSANDVGAVLVFSQPQYAPGDTAFFAGHLVADKTGFERRALVDIVLIDNGNVERLRERFWFEKGVAFNRFVIPSDIEPGMYKLALFVEYGTKQKNIAYSCDFPIAGELQVISSLQDVPDSLAAGLKGLKPIYTTRERVNFEVNPFRNQDRDSILMSVSVYQKNLFPGKSILYSLKKSNSVNLADSLNLLRNLKYPSYFAGQVVHKQTGKPAPDSLRITFYLNSYDLVYSVLTYSNGTFRFPLFQNFTTQDIFYVISSDGKILDDYKIMLVEPSIATGDLAKPQFGGRNEFTVYNRQRQVIHKSFSFFNSAGQRITEEEADSFEGDHEVRMDKYDPFKSMEEVFLNVVPMVKVRKEGDSYRMRMFLKDLQGYGERDPIFVINGIMTDNTGAVMQLDPQSIKKFVVLRSSRYLARFGDIGANGILVIETTNPSGTGIDSKNTLRVQGVNKFEDFSTAASTPGQRIPDLRHVLFYKPMFSTDGVPISFTTSDDTGVYVIELVGVANNKRFTMKTEFEVVRPE